jgi:hypothetical protein
MEITDHVGLDVAGNTAIYGDDVDVVGIGNTAVDSEVAEYLQAVGGTEYQASNGAQPGAAVYGGVSDGSTVYGEVADYAAQAAYGEENTAVYESLSAETLAGSAPATSNSSTDAI